MLKENHCHIEREKKGLDQEFFINEIKKLNLIVDMYLDYAEFQAGKGKLMYMKDWAKKLDASLQFKRVIKPKNQSPSKNQIKS